MPINEIVDVVVSLINFALSLISSGIKLFQAFDGIKDQMVAGIFGIPVWLVSIFTSIPVVVGVLVFIGNIIKTVFQ